MGLKTWQLTSDEVLTDADRQKIANEILQGSNGGMLYSMIETTNISSVSINSNLDYMNHCKVLIKGGQILAAVKFYKEQTGVGLKEAKDFIDELRENM